MIDGKRHRKQYWLFTSDPETLPDNSTRFVMLCTPAIKLTELGVANPGKTQFRLYVATEQQTTLSIHSLRRFLMFARQGELRQRKQEDLAKRYEKQAENYLAMLSIAAILLWL